VPNLNTVALLVLEIRWGVRQNFWGSRDLGHAPFLDFSFRVFEVLPLYICVPNFKSLALVILEICQDVLITKYTVQPVLKAENRIAHAPCDVTWR